MDRIFRVFHVLIGPYFTLLTCAYFQLINNCFVRLAVPVRMHTGSLKSTKEVELQYKVTLTS